ncbi:hypothetical protein AOQ84DRAFT_380493 [Glonium stellatum]|uniref:DUF7580 domain-containing protein n=1 Tax=Glonium stellatum TaxID=574774 RepID=A0A8E2ETU7_9PEZI|nr:hypothetical protein AOQ84DRAFT_380493 [Glonium stellatum]
MSGFEAVGIVLGSLPLIISALEHYRDGVRTIQIWRRYDRELKSLIRNLDTERAKFQNICETLLVGLVPSSRVEKMIDNPFGPLWQDTEISEKLRVRLWSSFKAFEATVIDMKEAIKEIKQKLDLGPNGEVQWTTNATIAREIGRVKFAFSREDYRNVLKRIQDNNSNLETLTTQSILLEPERRGRRQGRWLKLSRDISRSIFNALRSSMVCECVEPHGVNLELTTRPADITPHDDDEKIAQEFFFRITLSFNSTSSSTSQAAWLWDEIIVRLATRPASQESTMITTSVPITPNKKKAKRVKFSMPKSSATQTRSRTAAKQRMPSISTTVRAVMAGLNMGTALGMPNSPENLPKLVDLCQTIRKSQKQAKSECYGFIVDPSYPQYRKYGVYPLGTCLSCNTWSTISLRDVLKDNTSTQPPLNYTDRLHLAVVISSGVIQLHKTPWLPDILIDNDIIFIRRNSTPLYQHVFVTKRLPERISAPSDIENAKFIPIIRNASLLALGIILIEVILAETFDTLRGPEDALSPDGGANIVTDYMTASRLVDRVYQLAGSNYGSAVRRCVHCEFDCHNPSLDDDGFRQDVYDGVVALLEKDLKNSQNLT